jgi:excisionase family DNA binding protein
MKPKPVEVEECRRVILAALVREFAGRHLTWEVAAMAMALAAFHIKQTALIEVGRQEQQKRQEPPRQEPPRSDGVRAMSVAKAASTMGIGRATLYTLLAERKLGSLTVGKRRLIEVAEIERFIAERRKP